MPKAIEARYPMLRETIRERDTKQRASDLVSRLSFLLPLGSIPGAGLADRGRFHYSESEKQNS